MLLNDNFKLLSGSYLFSEVARRIAAYREENPDADIIRMDIGDVTLPIAGCVAEEIARAANEQSHAGTFHGYGPEQGYGFLRELISRHDYEERGIEIMPYEIFISDGAKSDIANLTDLFGEKARVGVVDPVYPVYVDSNEMAGRNEENGRLVLLPTSADSGFKPRLPEESLDVVYLCSPDNPTGTVLTRTELEEWVAYARANHALIIFDSAYESYVTDPGIPRSIYEIAGAHEVAIEVRSFSKTAGFTGLRCGYTVVPTALHGCFSDGSSGSLHDMWRRRQTTKFNGASYVVQRGAAALYTPEGRSEVARCVGYYMENARILRAAFADNGYDVTGGINSPYVWVKASKEGSEDSWRLFESVLRGCHVTSTPGVGFGRCGEGCLRFTGFNTREKTLEAADRLSRLKF